MKTGNLYVLSENYRSMDNPSSDVFMLVNVETVKRQKGVNPKDFQRYHLRNLNTGELLIMNECQSVFDPIAPESAPRALPDSFPDSPRPLPKVLGS